MKRSRSPSGLGQGADDDSNKDSLVEYLTDFALTLVHIPTAVTPSSMLSCERKPQSSPQRHDTACEATHSEAANHLEVWDEKYEVMENLITLVQKVRGIKSL